jgi:tetratricopeptide (TPR) repeat protein
MSFKEVKELRKSGKLDEALIIANQDLEKEPVNIWNKRSIAWVYHAYIKEYASKENFDNFIEFLNKLKSLELPADEKMVFDTCAYQIGKMLFNLAHDDQIDYKNVNLIFEHIKDFHFTKPSEAYSFLYKAFHKCYKNWSNYIPFAAWWGFENFSSQDFLSEEFKGKKIMSIVEQAYIAYSKKLLEGEAKEVDGFLLPKAIDKFKIKEHLPKLDTIIESHPEYQYPPYFKAKLLLALGDEKEVLSNFIPFAKKKRNDFWVWELLADTFQPEDERKMACLCKALILKTPNEFLINTRQKLAVILVKENKFKEAKTEIEKILIARNENNWKIPQQITGWTEQPWYKNSPSHIDNFSFYKQYIKIAEEILYADIQEETVVIEFVNENKSIINFIKDKSKHGFFKYAGMIEKPEIGNLISVRFNGEGQDGFYKALSIKKVTDDIPCEAIKEFIGNLKMREPANFGFVEDVFIEPKLIVKRELINFDLIKGKAVLSFNKKKNLWGWKAIKIY